MFIDQLAVIAAKTHGNLNQEEARVLDGALGQLEAAFIEVASRTEGFHPGESLVDVVVGGDRELARRWPRRRPRSSD